VSLDDVTAAGEPSTLDLADILTLDLAPVDQEPG